MNIRLEQEGEFWVVYRNNDIWGDCPVFISKSRSQAEQLYKSLSC